MICVFRVLREDWLDREAPILCQTALFWLLLVTTEVQGVSCASHLPQVLCASCRSVYSRACAEHAEVIRIWNESSTFHG